MNDLPTIEEVFSGWRSPALDQIRQMVQAVFAVADENQKASEAVLDEAIRNS